jgi:hypothetical protein
MNTIKPRADLMGDRVLWDTLSPHSKTLIPL